MFQRLINTLTHWLFQRTFADDDELALYLMSITANAFALLVHIYLLVVFLLFNNRLLIIVGIFSVLSLAAMFPLIARRKYKLFGLALSFDVSLYATLYGILYGMETHVVAYYMLVLIMQVIIPYAKPSVRVCIAVYTVVCITVCVVITTLFPPSLLFTPVLNKLLMISNIYILVIGTVAELYVGNIANFIVDMLKRVKMTELSTQANTDPLTGLYNRRYANQYFESLSDTQNTCVAMLDIDDFKLVNDTYGHQAGDEVLQFLSAFLTTNLRKSDVIFRWGGEEYLIILVDIDLASAQHVLEKVRRNLADTVIHTSKADIRITVTIGIAPLHTDDIQKSITQSDSRLYEGKFCGKDRVMI